MEKPIDFWLRKGKAGGEPKPTESIIIKQKRAIAYKNTLPLLQAIFALGRACELHP
jgi:hypothetical protein